MLLRHCKPEAFIKLQPSCQWLPPPSSSASVQQQQRCRGTQPAPPERRRWWFLNQPPTVQGRPVVQRPLRSARLYRGQVGRVQPALPRDAGVLPEVDSRHITNFHHPATTSCKSVYLRYLMDGGREEGRKDSDDTNLSLCHNFVYSNSGAIKTIFIDSWFV